jgi:hypothetical protein
MQLFITRIFLTIFYPLLLLAWLVNILLRRDRLFLHHSRSKSSWWIERAAQPDTVSYFSEASVAEGGSEPTTAKFLIKLLRIAAWLYRPSRKASEPIYKVTADREQGIPDEIYTLW